MAYRDADFHNVRPTQEEVAALLYERLTQQGGHETVSFDETTTPTETQVDLIIDQATGQLLDRVGVPIKESQLRRGKWLATVYSASLIAQEHTPEQRLEAAAYTGLIGEYVAQLPDFIDSNRKPYALHLG